MNMGEMLSACTRVYRRVSRGWAWRRSAPRADPPLRRGGCAFPSALASHVASRLRQPCRSHGARACYEVAGRPERVAMPCVRLHAIACRPRARERAWCERAHAMEFFGRRECMPPTRATSNDGVAVAATVSVPGENEIPCLRFRYQGNRIVVLIGKSGAVPGPIGPRIGHPARRNRFG